MRFACAARTARGTVRAANEDNYLMLADRGVFIVADGMGGHAAGETASEMAVRTISQEVGCPWGLSAAEVGGRVRAAVRTASIAIYERALAEPALRGMGTTATVLVLVAGGYLIGQVGDSRAYRFRNGKLLQLTRDHSYVLELVDAGILTMEQARVHPCRNVITRCLGGGGEVAPDIYQGSLEPGDILLLTSDGLTEMLPHEHLIEILSWGMSPLDWVDRMIAEANGRGGSDNITVIAIRIGSEAPNRAMDGTRFMTEETASGPRP